ncbi:MAG: glycosyltransferase family 39 protein [Microgenomates group bacterium]|jgi:4-amino-4-deoxy-L-arabinose transferase-like glycosyltransferase
MTKKIKIIFFVIIVLAAVLRIYKLDSIPPALNWDEIDAGYNAYTIANWGRDEWGQSFPLVFTSFKDDKHPVHIYFAAISVKLLGLNDFSTRLPAALFGVFCVAAMFFLARLWFKSDLVAIFAALFLAISPYNIQFSRGLWETNFALFFFLMGFIFFYKSINRNVKFLILSIVSFFISILSYHSPVVVVPPIMLLLILLYFREIIKIKHLFVGIIVLALLTLILVLNPRILGLARIKQTKFGDDLLRKTQMYQLTKNNNLAALEIALSQYPVHYTSEYLFEKGDQSARNSVKVFGEFYKIDAIFMLIGFAALVFLRSRVTLILFAWILLAPLPSALVMNPPNATRALFMMGSLHMLSALGAATIIKLIPLKPLKIISIVAILLILGSFSKNYLDYYFNVYPSKESIDWQYGMKQIVEYVKDHNGYSQIYVTDIRSQPYIFFLYYLKTPLSEFLDTASYNNGKMKDTSLVSFYDKYYFGEWDPIESMPNPGVLYAVTASQYDGLRYKSVFDVKKRIKYLDGRDAFFLVSYP